MATEKTLKIRGEKRAPLVAEQVGQEMQDKTWQGERWMHKIKATRHKKTKGVWGTAKYGMPALNTPLREEVISDKKEEESNRESSCPA